MGRASTQRMELHTRCTFCNRCHDHTSRLCREQAYAYAMPSPDATTQTSVSGCVCVWIGFSGRYILPGACSYMYRPMQLYMRYTPPPPITQCLCECGQESRPRERPRSKAGPTLTSRRPRLASTFPATTWSPSPSALPSLPSPSRTRSSPSSAPGPTPPPSTPSPALAAGTRHNLAVSRCGHLYSWGLGNRAQLGLGSEEEAETPTLVRSKQLRPYDSVAPSAGGQHCVLLARIRAD